MRSLFKHVISKWSKHIEDPKGYPDKPPIGHCWLWTGTKTRAGVRRRMRFTRNEGPIHIRDEKFIAYPLVSFCGQMKSPNQILWAYQHGVELDQVPRPLRRTCGNPLCINPLHTTPGQRPQTAEPIDAEPEALDWGEPDDHIYDPRKDLFDVFYRAGSMDQIKLQIPNKEAIDTYYPQYTEFIKGKTDPEIRKALEQL